MDYFRGKVLAYLEERHQEPLPDPDDIHSGRPPALCLPDEENDRILTLNENVTILSALHDVACPGVEKIGPWSDDNVQVPVEELWLPCSWEALKSNARNRTNADRQLIE